MNKMNGGKQWKRKDTVIPMNNPDPCYRGLQQKMTLKNGQPKGLQQTLKERGFNVAGLRAKCSPICPIENEGCCMAHLLSQQDDFQHQMSLLEQTITARGHLCVFLPKFHCELNPIEMVHIFSYHAQRILISKITQYWGWCKGRYREVYKVKFKDAKKTALEYLNTCPVKVIQRFFNRSWRFMDAYWHGLTGKAAEWAIQKQRSHRRVGPQAMMSVDAVLN